MCTVPYYKVGLLCTVLLYAAFSAQVSISEYDEFSVLSVPYCLTSLRPFVLYSVTLVFYRTVTLFSFLYPVAGFLCAIVIVCLYGVSELLCTLLSFPASVLGNITSIFSSLCIQYCNSTICFWARKLHFCAQFCTSVCQIVCFFCSLQYYTL